jgi:CRP/FNR family transcriptional regulator
MDSKQELLRRVPLFSRLNGAGLEELARLSDEVDLPAGRTFIREGDFGHEFFLVLDGKVRIERGGDRVNVLGPGDFLGEIALLDGGQRSATAIADTPVRLLVLGHREFNTLMADFPEIRIAVLEALAQRVRRHEPQLA